MLTWAAGFPAAEVLLQSWPPISLFAVAYRPCSAGHGADLAHFGRARARAGCPLGHAFFVGGLGIGAGMFLILVAQKLTDPVTVVIIASCAPLICNSVGTGGGNTAIAVEFCAGHCWFRS